MGNIDEKRLSALLERINRIRMELDALENEARGLEQPEETTDATPIDISITDIDLPPIVVEDPAAEYSSSPEVPEAGQGIDGNAATEPVDEPAEGPAEDPVENELRQAQADSEEEPAAVVSGTDIQTEPSVDDLPFDDDLPQEEPASHEEPSSEPEPSLDLEAEFDFKPVQEPDTKSKAAILDSKKAETAVMDVMAEKQAWRTDRPGSQVKNVISAISLNDRVLLINVLFREDPMLFQDTISAFNGMATLDEAVSYIQTNFPDWDLNSEPVYRLMMAVRRKLR